MARDQYDLHTQSEQYMLWGPYVTAAWRGSSHLLRVLRASPLCDDILRLLVGHVLGVHLQGQDDTVASSLHISVSGTPRSVRTTPFSQVRINNVTLQTPYLHTCQHFSVLNGDARRRDLRYLLRCRTNIHMVSSITLQGTMGKHLITYRGVITHVTSVRRVDRE